MTGCLCHRSDVVLKDVNADYCYQDPEENPVVDWYPTGSRIDIHYQSPTVFLKVIWLRHREWCACCPTPQLLLRPGPDWILSLIWWQTKDPFGKVIMVKSRRLTVLIAHLHSCDLQWLIRRMGEGEVGHNFPPSPLWMSLFEKGKDGGGLRCQPPPLSYMVIRYWYELTREGGADLATPSSPILCQPLWQR